MRERMEVRIGSVQDNLSHIANASSTRYLSTRDLHFMGPLHYDCPAYYSPFYELHASTEESRGRTRDGDIHIWRLVAPNALLGRAHIF